MRFYISPYFISRFYLARTLEKSVKEHKIKGSLIDIGCGSKPYRALFPNSDYKGIDFKNYSSALKDFTQYKPDYYFSDDYSETFRLPFKDNEFRNSMAHQVLEHHKKPSKLISEMYRITQDEGNILLSLPFIGGIHGAPDDYQRYTKYGLLELFKAHKFKSIEFKEYGSLASSISKLLSDYLTVFANKNRVNYLFALLLYPPFLLFQYLSFFLDKVFRSTNIFIGYFVILKVAKSFTHHKKL